MKGEAPPLPSALLAEYVELLNGVEKKGDGGVLYVKDGRAAYVLPSEFEEPRFRGGIETLLSKSESKELYYVVREVPGVRADVEAVPRAQVHAACEALPRRGGSG